MKFIDRYSGAVRSSNLKVDPRTTWSDSDVLGAAGYAAKKTPLGIALMRMLVEGKVGDCLSLMVDQAIDFSLTDAELRMVAQKVLAWYRFGTCEQCGGTGKEIIYEPKPHLSEEDCVYCLGTGRRVFDRGFTQKQIVAAHRMKWEIERNIAWAGNAAMKAIAPSLDI